MITAKLIESPLGAIIPGYSDKGLVFLEFSSPEKASSDLEILSRKLKCAIEIGEHPKLSDLENQLKEYFAGKRQTFDLDFDFHGTDFQKSVWNILLKIPYGETISYQKQAQMLNNEKAIRAVAAANGANNLAIVVPCHRVIGKNGKLTGYAGGIEKKQFLLELESKTLFDF